MIRVHFLNVGHGDCTIIKHHSGRLTMIDINNSQDYDDDSFQKLLEEQTQNESLRPISALGLPPWNMLSAGYAPSPPKSLLDFARQNYIINRNEALAKAKNEIANPIEFLQKNYPGEKIWRFVLTHPDLDHMRGIKALYDKIGFSVFWDTQHTKPTPSFRSDADKVDWEFYCQIRAGNNVRFYTRGNSVYAFGKDENGMTGGDNIEILSPTPELVRTCNAAGKSNSLSYVIRVSHAGKSVLLPGDAEEDAWKIMADYYENTLKSDFLKASHHGRDSAYNLNAVKLISPLITFVSVGRKPDTDASSKYRQQSGRVASTRYHGNIELRILDDGHYEWFVARNGG
jgi:competence protein ComEC